MPGRRPRPPPRWRCGRTSAAATASRRPRSTRRPAARRPGRPRPRRPPGPVRRAPVPAVGSRATPPTSRAACPPHAARNTAVSSSRPCGVSSPRKMSPLPAWNIKPAITPRLAAFWNRMYGIGMPSRMANPMHWAATHAVVHPHLQRERSGRVLAVVGREIVVHQLVDVAWRSDRRLHFRGCPPPIPRSAR